MLGFGRDKKLAERYGEPVIIVSGLPRSGTSMMMKMLEGGGLSLIQDGIRTADDDNPKGYFELEKVKDLDKTDDKAWVRDFRGRVLKVISFLLRDLPDENQYKVLFMRRHLDEVLASQNKMLANRGEDGSEGHDDDAMRKRYTMHLKKVAFMLDERENFRCLEVDHRGVIQDPRGAAKKVRKFLGLPLDVDGMAAAVDSKLYRNRA